MIVSSTGIVGGEIEKMEQSCMNYRVQVNRAMLEFHRAIILGSQINVFVKKQMINMKGVADVTKHNVGLQQKVAGGIEHLMTSTVGAKRIGKINSRLLGIVQPKPETAERRLEEGSLFEVVSAKNANAVKKQKVITKLVKQKKKVLAKVFYKNKKASDIQKAKSAKDAAAAQS